MWKEDIAWPVLQETPQEECYNGNTRHRVCGASWLTHQSWSDTNVQWENIIASNQNLILLLYPGDLQKNFNCSKVQGEAKTTRPATAGAFNPSKDLSLRHCHVHLCPKCPWGWKVSRTTMVPIGRLSQNQAPLTVQSSYSPTCSYSWSINSFVLVPNLSCTLNRYSPPQQLLLMSPDNISPDPHSLVPQCLE